MDDFPVEILVLIVMWLVILFIGISRPTGNGFSCDFADRTGVIKRDGNQAAMTVEQYDLMCAVWENE